MISGSMAEPPVADQLAGMVIIMFCIFGGAFALDYIRRMRGVRRIRRKMKGLRNAAQSKISKISIPHRR
jgi:hypothetical protein